MRNTITVETKVLDCEVKVRLNSYPSGQAYYTNTASISSVIRQILKQKYPSIKFQIKSSSHISIKYPAGIYPETVGEISGIADKFELGNFNGMTDSFDYKKKDQRIYIDYNGKSIELSEKYIFISEEIN